MEKRIDLKIKAQDLDTIIKALAEIPYRYAAPILADIKTQLNAKEEDKKDGGCN